MWLPSSHRRIRNARRRQPEYVDRGLCHAQLEQYLAHFRREQISIVIYEDMRRNPAVTMRAMYDFVSIDSGYVPAMAHCKVNESLEPIGSNPR